MQTTSSTVRLELLGGALLHVPERKAWKLERKTAALLAFLTLEGGTARSRLAGLLWPDSIESTARNNLSQVSRRLREGAGIALLTGDDRLSLSPELSIDASILELEAFAGNDESVLGFTGELLEGLDYDDCPEFQDWLLLKRENFLGLRRDAHLRRSKAAEQAGQPRLALEHANQVLELDPVSEVAHRHVMRLHYQNGDRGAALNAFERCKQTLEQELGVPPLPETLALAEAISHGATVEQTILARLEIPLTVLRPPVLIGREHEWAQLEQAWNQGLQIVIYGEPGIGKSRLLFDFATSHGSHLLLEGRPGDRNVSFSSYARSLRRVLSQYPTLELEDWVRSELSRLLPELTSTAPAPLQSQEEKLRFFEAIACALETICQQQVLSSMVVDDLQFMDAASLEAHEYIVTRLTPTGLRFLNAHRTNELPDTLEERIQTEIGTGTTTRLEIKPLEAEQVSRWITSLEISAASDLGRRLVKHTGGNPMFMLETIKSLLETNQLAQNAALPTPTRVGALIRQRLERLSSSALRLARVAAITGTDYSLGLAAKILETNALDLSEIAGELEQAQLMIAERFAHDLIFEAVRTDTPKSIATFVHQQTATHLENSQAEPARIAHHWIEAGQPINAVSHLENAVVKAVEQYQLREIVKHATQAATILEQANKPETAWEFWTRVRDTMRELAVGDELEVVIQALHRTASTPTQRAETLEAECEMWINRGNLSKAKRIADQSMEVARELDDLHVLELAEANLGKIAWMQGKSTQAATHFATSNEYGRLLLQQRIDLDAPQDEINRAKAGLAMGFANHAIILDNFGRYAESELEHKQAVEMLREVRDMITLNQELSNISITLLDQGRTREAIVYLEEANKNAASLTESTIGTISQYCTTSDAYLMLDQYTLALEYANRARGIAEQAQHPHLHATLIRLGTLHRILGAVEQAKDFFETSRISIMENITFRNPLARQYAVLLLEQNEDASAMVLEALTVLSKSEHVFRWYKTHLELLACLTPAERMPIINETLKKPALQSMKSLHILALTRGAQTQLEFGKPKKALDFSQRAIDLLKNYEPDLQRAEVLLAHQRALEANNHPDATAHLERTLAWLRDVADNHVPPEYRQSFLERNPHNAAILELARNAGLEIS
jgi:DNA-binding SARP family transcriptional activator